MICNCDRYLFYPNIKNIHLKYYVLPRILTLYAGGIALHVIANQPHYRINHLNIIQMCCPYIHSLFTNYYAHNDVTYFGVSFHT